MNSLALEIVIVIALKQPILVPFCACLFCVGLVRVYSSLEAVGWR